jgi:hypothetical protein
LRGIASTFGTRLQALAPDLQRLRVLAALLASEGRGVLDPYPRYESGRDDFSFGPCQILTGTAAGLLGLTPHPPALPKVLRVAGLKFPDQAHAAAWAVANPDALAWRALLRRPEVSTDLAAHYLRTIDAQGCAGDPILLYAGYNAGSPRKALHPHDAFGLVSYVRPDNTTALDSFSKWYGDACAVFTTP